MIRVQLFSIRTQFNDRKKECLRIRDSRIYKMEKLTQKKERKRNPVIMEKVEYGLTDPSANEIIDE